jgi:Ino eighty subunit 1
LASRRHTSVCFIFTKWPPTIPDRHVCRVGYLSRKALPIKRNDAEPLTREDVQFDLLDYIFNNPTVVFTNPIPGGNQQKMSFGDLYISALYNSSKCSKVLKEKMLDTPLFSIEFAKISLLTNVGRINTTMACKKMPMFYIYLLTHNPASQFFPK